MNFFDFCWSTAHQITRKTYSEMKILLHDELRYPYLGRGSNGYVLHLIKPRKLNEKYAFFQGLKFNLQNPTHKKIIWFLFKASVYHLCMHLQLSNFAAYSKWGRGKNPHVATFVLSLVEDAIINKRMANTFPWMQPEIAYANAISFLRMKEVDALPNDSSRIMASLLQNYSLGKVKGKLEDDMLTDVEAATSILKRLEENATFEGRLDAATKVYDAINVYGETFEVPSLLYTESHGTNDMFYEPLIPKEEEIQQILSEALRALSTEALGEEKLNVALQSLKESEAHQALTTWCEYEKAKSKILSNYVEIGKGTKFDDYVFPIEDYAEFQRKRELLSSPIRRILHQLRILKNVGGDDFRQESGFVDLQEAIQVIASKSQRTDIFVREELQTREDTWSILVDASHSLSLFKGEVQGIALCLAEVARMLILDQNSWGLYAFNNKFYVVKDFSEKYDSHVKARIGGLVHGGLTYLPDAVLLAAQALTKRLEESKILVIVSDFFPAGYDGAEEKLKETIKNIEKRGIGMIGIGVNSRAVRNYVRVNCVVEEPYDLMKKFTKAFMEYNSS
ncbi:MAG: vWA domain-containing protein [Candidatus Bathyarchaeia archaeon]